MNSKIVGNCDKIKYIEKLVEEDNISHAYVFTGIEGIGKQKIAKYFASKILKEDNIEACLDYKYIEKNEDSKDLQVDLIRDNLINDVYKKPLVSEKKVYIINDANKMNVTAQNVLLKTLEEPPKYVVIILIATTMDAFLPTIKSRLKEITFNKLSKSEMFELVENKEILEDNKFIIDYAAGSFGKLSKLLEESNIEKIQNLNNFIKILNEKKTVEAIKEAKKINFKLEDTLDYIQFIYYKKYEETLEIKYLKCIEIIELTKNRLKFNVNEEIALDSMVIKIIKQIS